MPFTAPLELLAPAGLALAALLAPLVVLYILKVRRKRRRVPSIVLWATAERDMLARSPWRRLIAEKTLLVEAAALVALALALARPATRGGDLLGDHVALVIDTSASMSAASPDGRARIELAREAARKVVGGLAPGSDVVVIEAGRDARVASPLDRDRGRVLAAIDGVRARDVAGDLAAAMALGVDRVAKLGGRARVVVVTDGDLASREPLPRSSVPVEILTVGAPVENAGIVRVDVRSGADPVDGREEVQAFLLVASFASRPRELYVTMREDGASDVLASRRLLLAPGERAPVVLTFHPTAGDHRRGLVFDVSPHDAMAVDDVAYGRVPAGQRLPVVLAWAGPAARPSPWLERALAADPGVDLREIPFAELASAAIDEGALVVVEGACPDRSPAGDLLVVAPPEGPCFGARVGRSIEHPAITSWEEGDPRLRFLTLDGVHIAKARLLEVPSASSALVRAQEGPLVADISTAAHTGTLLGFDVGESDWPLDASFVLFVRNIVEQARVHRQRGVTGPASVGEPMRVRVPASVDRAQIEGPDGDVQEIAARDGLAIIPDVSRAGFYRVTWKGPRPGSLVVPANLTSEAESDLRPRPLDTAASGATIHAAGEAPDGHEEHAWTLALAALALIVADVWLVTRDRRGAARRLRPVLVVAMIAGALPALHEGLAWAGLIAGEHLRVARPWVTVLALAATSFVALRLATWGARLDRARVRLVDAVASLAVVAASLAAAGVEVGRPLDRMSVLVAIDRSRSVDLVPGAAARVTQELAVAEIGMRDDDRIGTVAFASSAAIEDPLRPRSGLAAPQALAIGRDATDLGAAIRRALAEVPPDAAGRIVLLSDGVATRGDAMAAAAAAAAAELPIDVVVLEQRAVPDVRVVAVRAPSRADDGEALDLRVVTSSPQAAAIEVRVRRDGALVSRGPAKIAAGEDVLRIRVVASEPGMHRYDVEITALDEALDEQPEDNQGSAFVRVRGPSVALVLDGDPGSATFVAKALEAGGFIVQQGGAAALPFEPGGLAGYDLVVLGDLRAPDLSPAQIDALASWVRDLGGGLVLLGGDRSMGPGGYGRTPIEDVSPVSFDLKQEERRASLAEVIGIDISGSMAAVVAGRTKLELANEAAARSAALLGPGDMLGVAHVDTTVQWSVPLGPVADAAAIERAIRAVGSGGGGIYVDITLAAAYRELDARKVNLKHVLLFADGADAEQMAGCRAMVEGALRRGITTSVIALGLGADVPELELLSRLGGGRFYLLDDASRLPSVFAQETILAARSSIVEEPFRAALGMPGEPTAGIDFGEAPPLGGYVVTIPKGRARVLLTGPEGDPLLASWSAGVGRAAAFTSDLEDRWGHAWTAWSGAARMIAQVARDVSRRADDPRVRLDADATGGELHVRASVLGDDGRAEAFRRLTAHVAGPGGFVREVPLEATGAGAYAATIPLARPGAYVAIARDDLSGDVLGTTGAALAAGEELRPTGSDAAALLRIAQLTGGRRRDGLAGIFDDRASRRFAYDDVTGRLVLLAACALLLAVAARRFAIPEALVAALDRARASRRAHAPRPAAAAPDPHGVVASLLTSKRARTDRSAPEPPPDRPAPRPADAPIVAPQTIAAARPPPVDAPGARPRSAAEILAERRKNRR